MTSCLQSKHFRFLKTRRSNADKIPLLPQKQETRTFSLNLFYEVNLFLYQTCPLLCYAVNGKTVVWKDRLGTIKYNEKSAIVPPLTTPLKPSLNVMGWHVFSWGRNHRAWHPGVAQNRTGNIQTADDPSGSHILSSEKTQDGIISRASITH